MSAELDAQVYAFVSALGPGRRSCRSSYDLAKVVGVGQRSIGFIANTARREGHLVGSVHGQGYYLIETEAELEATISHIVHRITGIHRTIDRLRDSWTSAA